LAAPDLLAVLRRVEGRGAIDIAKRTHDVMGRIFRYAVHELRHPHAVIERQLAHGERNKVSASYNFADYLDKLKTGADAIPLHDSAA